MTPRTLQTHVNRRYRAGARLALLATLLVGVAASGLAGSSAPTIEISRHRDATPDSPIRLSTPLPDPEIEPAALTLPTQIPNEPAAALGLDHPVDFAAQPAPAVERLVL